MWTFPPVSDEEHRGHVPFGAKPRCHWCHEPRQDRVARQVLAESAFWKLAVLITLLLGVRAVIAESFERIHRSNLVGMGVLPLVFKQGENAESLGLAGTETYDIEGLESGTREVTVNAAPEQGASIRFTAEVRVDTPKEWEYFNNGGILQYVLRQLAA